MSRQEFTYEQFILNDSTMAQTAPGSTVYVEDQDFAAMTYSGSGDVTGDVQCGAFGYIKRAQSRVNNQVRLGWMGGSVASCA